MMITMNMVTKRGILMLKDSSWKMRMEMWYIANSKGLLTVL